MINIVKSAITAVILSVIFFSISLHAETVDFPEKIQIDEQRSVPFRNYAVFAPVSFSLYAIGLYVAGTETDNMKLKNSDEPMAIHLVSLYRRLKMKTLIDELRRGFSYGMDHDKKFLKTIQERIDDFIKLLENTGKNPRKYNAITFLYVPKEGTHVSFRSEYLGTIPGHDFKKALFGIWLNNNCANDELRDRVIKIRKK
ncbi:MAG TPA: chalcone isomerase family protein [bacterium]|nr:chalcone isomerase family protein [bacterium]HQO91327.1 chalcone isomerase family protein [bacterium]